MTSELRPRARKKELIVRTLASGETVVYDLETHEAHCLNQTSAMVWRRCDGTTTLAEMASEITMELDEPFTEELVHVALAELDEAGLLENMPLELKRTAAMTRRQAMSRIGKGALIAALIPLITTILAPTPAAAGSCLPSGASCTSGYQCCSGFCNSGTCE